MADKRKRKRGGQRGNASARKHVTKYWKARHEGVPYEVAMFRTKAEQARGLIPFAASPAAVSVSAFLDRIQKW